MEKIKCKVRIKSIRYFKNDWGIASAIPFEFTSGTPELDMYNGITIKGSMIEPKIDGEYFLIAEKVIDPKYGTQYEVISMATAIGVDVHDESSKRMYLESIFTERQVEALYAGLTDPFSALMNKDYESLVKVRGVGGRNAISWSNRFEENYSISRLYTELGEYELTPGLMKKLLKHYNSPDLVIKHVTSNPYILTEVGGIGFKIADAIALKGGIHKWDQRRIGTYIVYALEERGANGNSYISSDELMDILVEMFGEDLPDIAVSQAIHGDIEEKLWWSNDKAFIGLKRYRELEQNICDELMRLMKADSNLHCENVDEVIAKTEEEQGWEFTDEQRAAIHHANDNNVTIITGSAGCVDCDTEFFTGHGWKRIADYEEGDLVLQYNEDETAELVEPVYYIKNKCDTLYHFETKYGLSQTLSLNHKFAYETCRGKFKKESFESVKEKQEHHCFYGKVRTAFHYEGPGISLSDDEIRLMVAVIADGHFSEWACKPDSSVHGEVRINLKKDRKKQRLESLLDAVCIDWKKTTTTVDGYHRYNFHAPFIAKHFPKSWYECSAHQLSVIADEVMYWDGEAKKHNQFSTTSKEDADFIQYVYSALGYRASISVDDRSGRTYLTCGKEYIRKSAEYSVQYTDRTRVGLCHDHGKYTPITPVATKDGYEYCFEVPSGYLVLRNNNRIFITGNCGKTSLAKAIRDLYPKASASACCLAGKAAARLGEVLGTPGSTIHRLLGFAPSTGFLYNKDSQLLQQLIIIDEISMIGGRLFYDLIQSIRSGAKVIMLGDTGQLEAIGECNIAMDMIDSGVIPVERLTKIHRQAAKSAIISEANKVRNSGQLISKDWVGTEVRGELQDLKLDCYSDKTNTAHKMLKYFKEEMEKNGNDPFKVQMVSAMRSRGESSVWNLNLHAQEICNPDRGQDSIEVYYPGRGTADLRVGDKVINVRNNYRDCIPVKENEDGVIRPVPIFNGYMGIIREIDKKGEVLVIDYWGTGDVIVPFDCRGDIELAYAITCHKLQGNQSQSVIVALDYSAYALLSKEWLYTAITRAQKNCILVAQNSALRYSCATEKTTSKQTHLCTLLKKEVDPLVEFDF